MAEQTPESPAGDRLEDLASSVRDVRAKLAELRQLAGSSHTTVGVDAAVDAASDMRDLVIDLVEAEVLSVIALLQDNAALVVDVRDGAAHDEELYHVHVALSSQIDELSRILARLGDIDLDSVAAPLGVVDDQHTEQVFQQVYG